MTTSVYFIALLPQQEIQEEVTAFKHTAAKKFNTKRALTSPPHVTLVAPFKYEDEKIQDVIAIAKKYAEQQKPFNVALKDFNCFAPRVIYVDVKKSTDMDVCYQALNKMMESNCGIEFQYKNQEFHPHMTVAFKDLKEDMFPKAWKYFRREKFERTFEAKVLTLLKHDGKAWQIFENFGLNGTDER